MKQVVHVITTILRGGAENQLKVLVREQIRCGYQVTIYYLKKNPELQFEFESMGAKVDDRLIGKNFINQCLIFKSLICNYSGIVHAHLPRAELLCSVATTGKKLIVSRHNAEPFFPGAPRYFSKLLSRFVEKRARMVIAISYAVRDFLLDSKEILEAQKVRVIHYSYDPNFGNNSKQVNLGLNSKFIVGTIARLTPQKDLSTLIIAFQSFLVKHDDAMLLIIGSGELRIKLQSLAFDLGISESIIWIGRIDDVKGYLEIMDIFVLPSKYEGFGLVILESIQVGTAVIASRNSAMLEVLGENSKALFTTGDWNELDLKLCQFRDVSNRLKLISNQKSRLKVFEPSKMIKKFNLVYKEVQGS